MKSFAFMVSPITIKQLKNFWLSLRIMSFPSFKVLYIKKIQSIQKKIIQGYLIRCPGLPTRISESKSFVIDKIMAAGDIAKRLGAKILGLDGYFSLLLDKEYIFAKNLKIALTTGNALTAWSVIEAIYRVAKIKNMDLKKSTLAVVGADSCVGNLCVRKLSDYVSSTANPKDADIVINTNNPLEDTFDMEELKPNAIVCGVYLSNNTLNKVKLRPDITVIQAGLIKLPFLDKLGINTGLPKGIIWASLAETMLLTFEERFTNYSLGENINLDKLEEIANMSARHGFEVWVPEAPVL